MNLIKKKMKSWVAIMTVVALGMTAAAAAGASAPRPRTIVGRVGGWGARVGGRRRQSISSMAEARRSKKKLEAEQTEEDRRSSVASIVSRVRPVNVSQSICTHWG